MSFPEFDLYGELEISQDATAEEIKKAYRKLARQYHPDRNSEPGAEARFKRISEAHDVLGDPDKRAAYDSWLVNPFGFMLESEFSARDDDLVQYLEELRAAGFFDGQRSRRPRRRPPPRVAYVVKRPFLAVGLAIAAVLGVIAVIFALLYAAYVVLVAIPTWIEVVIVIILLAWTSD